jgi:hypothetical protein
MKILCKSLMVEILVVITVFAYTKIGFAESNKIWDVQYRGVRAMGMGNAFDAISDDSDSVYYNPAGMTSVRKVKVYFQPVRLVQL